MPHLSRRGVFGHTRLGSSPQHGVTNNPVISERDGKRDRCFRTIALLDTDHRTFTANLRRLLLLRPAADLQPQLERFFRIHELHRTKEHSRVADILCRPLKPFRTVRLTKIYWKMKRETSCTIGGVMRDFSAHD